jgi:hypothetical protein
LNLTEDFERELLNNVETIRTRGTHGDGTECT